MAFAFASAVIIAFVPAFTGVGHAEPITAKAFDTYAGISCLWVQGQPVLSYTASGNAYGNNQQIDVYLDVQAPQALAKSEVTVMDASTSVWTDSRGFWSVPTYTEWPGGGGGPWTLYVDVYRHNSGKLGSAWDQCWF
jgi:hypothetical protein